MHNMGWMKVLVVSSLLCGCGARESRQPVAGVREGTRERVVLRSSTIREAAYDRATGTLALVFPDGATYAYAAVPEQAYLELKAAASPGRYFHAHIRESYTATRVVAPAARNCTSNQVAAAAQPRG